MKYGFAIHEIMMKAITTCDPSSSSRENVHGKPVSIFSMSPESRFRMRPIGFLLKKRLIDACIMRLVTGCYRRVYSATSAGPRPSVRTKT